MSAVAGTFLAIGGLSLLLLVLALAGGHVHIGHLHLGHLRVGHGGAELSLPMIAGFLGAFGFGGAIVASLLPGAGAATWLAATVVGLIAAVPASWLAGRLLQAAVNLRTDATLSSSHLLGTEGVIISPVPADGLGEVRLGVAGQPMKFYARSDQPLALGTRVFVIAVPSPTSVLVEPTPQASTVD
jgi:membrane protein implicated in regulation of membrane protease activity